MYMQDERLRQNIDLAGGEGTSELVSRAITVHKLAELKATYKIMICTSLKKENSKNR